MNTNITLNKNAESFTLNGTLYCMNLETKRYSKTGNGKKTRIGKAEYEAAKAEADELDHIETIKEYWMATMAMDETREQMDKFWATEEGMKDLMGWFEDEKEAGLTEEDMQEAIIAAKVQEAEESANTEAGEETAKKILDEAMEELGYYPIDGEWNDIRYSNSARQVMAWNTVEEGMEWVKEQELETEARMLENYCRHPEGTDLQKPAALNEYGCVDCSKCNVQNCIRRDCMKRNLTNEGGLAECPRLKVHQAAESKYSELEAAAEEAGVTVEEYCELVEEPEAKQPEIKKARKLRKSKDIAYEGNSLTLTVKQVDFIKHLPDTCYWEDGVNSVIWVDCLCDDIQGQFQDKPMTVGAMISTLCEKGLGKRATERRDGRKCTSFELTELGKLVAAELGLE